MPSPVGHGLAGLAAGWLSIRPQRLWRPGLRQAAILALISMAPDLDLLWGRHSRETHSVGAALAVAAGLIEGVVNLRRGALQTVQQGDVFEREIQAWSRSFQSGKANVGVRTAFYLKGTIRGDLALSMPDNLVHGSDSPEAAERLIPFVAAYIDDVSLADQRITVDWGLDY